MIKGMELCDEESIHIDAGGHTCSHTNTHTH